MPSPWGGQFSQMFGRFWARCGANFGQKIGQIGSKNDSQNSSKKGAKIEGFWGLIRFDLPAAHRDRCTGSGRGGVHPSPGPAERRGKR